MTTTTHPDDSAALAVRPAAVDSVLMMDEDEAHEALQMMRGDLEQVDVSLSSFRQRALDFTDRQGWRALGYGGALEAINAELGTQYSKSYLSRLLKAAEIERLLELPMGNSVPERALRPLGELETPEEQRQAWQQASEQASGTPTAKAVQQAVDDVAAFEDAHARFAALGWRLERHGAWFKLSEPDGSHYASTPDLVPQLRTLATFEAGAARRAATAADTTQPTPKTDSPPCERCGQPSADKHTIGGLLAWRCAACRAQTETEDLTAQLGPQYRGTVDRADMGGIVHRIAWDRGGGGDYTYSRALDKIAALPPLPDNYGARLRLAIDRALSLGATVDAARQRRNGQIPVIPPAGHQQAELWANAAELQQFCDSWERFQRGQPHAETPGVWGWGPTLAALRACQHAVFMKDRAAALRAGFAFVSAVAGDESRAYAVHLLTALAPLMADRQPEDPAGLAVAIDDLHVCDPGTEGRYLARAVWALLDVEPPEGAP